MTQRILDFCRWLQTRVRHYLSKSRALAPSEHDVFYTDGALAVDEPIRRSHNKRQVDPEVADHIGLWHLRSTILDRLNEYFVCIRRLQRHDPHSYALFARVGFTVPPDAFHNVGHTTTRDRMKSAPRVTFGGILTGGFAEDQTKKRCVPSFIYFTKLDHPSSVQSIARAEGVVYKLTALYDDRIPDQRWRSRLSIPVSCHLFLRHDGTVQLLKELIVTRSVITTGLKRKGKRDRLTLSTRHWEFPSWLSYLEEEEDRKEDKQAWISNLFTMALLTYENTIEQIIVRVEHRGSVAAFGIQLPRAKYFFADREIELTASGQRKRIFHAVVAHSRALANGRTVQVRAHYRGLRHFDWNDYHVTIVLPANARVLRFDAPSSYLEDVPPSVLMLTESEVGDKISEVLST